MVDAPSIHVIDTSSIIQVRRFVHKGQLERVFSEMDGLVEDGSLVYPVEVVRELERFTDPHAKDPDWPFEWARRNQAEATRHGPSFEVLSGILQHPQVRKVVDPDKVGVEEADPHVLALAVRLGESSEVTVLNEERVDKPHKLSLTTACGLLRVISLPMEAFLEEKGIWPP